MKEDKMDKKKKIHTPPVPEVLWIFIILFLILVAGEVFQFGVDSVEIPDTFYVNTFKEQYQKIEAAEVKMYKNLMIRVNRFLPDSKANAYAQEIWNAAEVYGFEGKLFVYIIIVESGVKDYVVSSAGAIGLCQIMPFHLDLLKSKGIFNNYRDFYDGVKSIRGATYLLASYLEWADGDVLKALAAYNAGKGNWRAGLDYAAKVLRIYEKYW